jgi:hypothetical protein
MSTLTPMGDDGATTLAVLGDLSGWAAPFFDALRLLGCDPATGSIPSHLLVVQVGDLVHKGPDGTASSRATASSRQWTDSFAARTQTGGATNWQPRSALPGPAVVEQRRSLDPDHAQLLSDWRVARSGRADGRNPMVQSHLVVGSRLSTTRRSLVGTSSPRCRP